MPFFYERTEKYVRERLQLFEIEIQVRTPEPEKYGGQRVFVIEVEGYAYLVPFLETENEVVLKTVIPSRKATRQYLGGET